MMNKKYCSRIMVFILATVAIMSMAIPVKASSLALPGDIKESNESNVMDMTPIDIPPSLLEAYPSKYGGTKLSDTRAVTDTTQISWNLETTMPTYIPNTVWTQYPGSDIVDFAVSADGMTFYVAIHTAGPLANPKKLLKGTMGGAIWTDLTSLTNDRLAMTNLDSCDFVAISPDDPNVVVVLDVGGLDGAIYAAASKDGGLNFYDMGVITGGAGDITVAYDLDVSPISSGNIYYVGIAGINAAGPAIYYYNFGAAVGAWHDAVSDFGIGTITPIGTTPPWLAAGTIDDFRAVQFSSNFGSDFSVLAISEETSVAMRLHVFSLASHKWDSDLNLIAYPVIIDDVDNIGDDWHVNAASITMGPDFMGIEEETLITFVGASISEDDFTEDGGIYRIDETVTVTTLKTTAVNSVTFDGTVLVAGSYDTNNVWSCFDPMSITPTVTSANPLKRIGVDDAGNDMVIVALAGDTVYGAKRGDSSALSKSLDYGVTWNDFTITISSNNTITPPSIDGQIDPGEWGAPSITKTLAYMKDDIYETHDFSAYFVNDHDYLYIAITVANEDFESETSNTGEDIDVIEIYFDNDNDGIIEENEDIKNFWNLKYGDWYYKGENKWSADGVDNIDGEGVASHSNQGIGDYNYEFKIPLRSNDIHDLSVNAGDTIGIKILFREMYWDAENQVWTWLTSEGDMSEDGWPDNGGRFEGSTYGKLVLSGSVDTTPPTTPFVTVDGGPFAGTTELHASWSSSDPESGIMEYQYAIGTTSGGTDVMTWTSVGVATEVTQPVAGLSVGNTYYFTVKAKNGQGLWSDSGTSNGIILTAVVLDLPSDWLDKQLFYPIYSRVSSSPGLVEIGVGSKRDMWYLVNVYTRHAGQTSWQEYRPDEWVWGKYLVPWGQKTFSYTPIASEEIKLEVKNDLNDDRLTALWATDFALRSILGVSISPNVTDTEAFWVELLTFYNDYMQIGAYLGSGQFDEAVYKLGRTFLEPAAFEALYHLLPQLGVSISWSSAIAKVAGIVFYFGVNVPIWWDFVQNTNKDPFIEDVVYTAKAKTVLIPTDIRVIESLRLVEPAPYSSGETITARFTVVNRDTAPVEIKLLTVGGRGPQGDTDIHDFTYDTNITLNPGESHNYEGNISLSDIGYYHFFIAYQTPDGVWFTDVPTEEAAINTVDIEVGPLPDRLITNICSPGELRIYDSQNRVTGLVNGEAKEEIPNSIYYEQGEIVVIYTPSDTYRYEIEGIDEGNYGLDVAFIEDGEAAVFSATEVPINNGVKYEYTIDWDAISQGQPGVIINKDSNGDGTFEETITTAPPYSPSIPLPPNEASNISIITTLAWTGGDPDQGDDVTYKVYFGDSTNPPLVSDNQTGNRYALSNLNYDTTYYWRVVARDNHGITTEGPIWGFTTSSRSTSSSGGGGGGGGGSSDSTSLSEFITSEGKFVVDATAQSADQLVKILIPKDTVGKDRNGGRLRFITIKKQTAPPEPPANCGFVCLTYDIGPGGANLEPFAYLTFFYSDSQVPTGVAEENLVLATLQDGDWVMLEGCIVDPEKNTVTAPISHFSVYAAIAYTAPAEFEAADMTVIPAEIETDAPVSISVTVTNTGDLISTHKVVLMLNNIYEQDKEITLKGGESQTVSFTMNPDKVGEYTVIVGGLSGRFTVKEPEPEGKVAEIPALEPPVPSPTPTAQAEGKPVAPIQPEKEPEGTVQSPIETIPRQATAWWFVVIYIACGVIVVGLGAYFFMRRRSTAE